MSRQRSKNLFAELIASARAHKEWDVRTAAEKLSYSSQQWRNFENGSSRPPMERLEHLATVLGLDLATTFSCWVRETLSESESPKLRDLLGRWGAASPATNLPIGRPLSTTPALNVPYDLSELPLDDATVGLAYSVVEETLRHISTFRKKLFKTSQPRLASVGDKPIPHQGWARKWRPIKGMQTTKRKAIAFSRDGLGYMSSLIKVEAGHGVYHKEINTEYHNAGMEFFAVLKGAGVGFLEAEPGEDWRVMSLQTTLSGAYPAKYGHGIVNPFSDDLVVLITAVPFNPQSQIVQPVGKTSDGVSYAGATDFEIRELSSDRLQLPYKLKHDIQSKISSIPQYARRAAG